MLHGIDWLDWLGLFDFHTHLMSLYCVLARIDVEWSPNFAGIVICSALQYRAQVFGWNEDCRATAKDESTRA